MGKGEGRDSGGKEVRGFFFYTLPAAYILRRVLIKSVRANTDLISTRRNKCAT